MRKSVGWISALLLAFFAAGTILCLNLIAGPSEHMTVLQQPPFRTLLVSFLFSPILFSIPIGVAAVSQPTEMRRRLSLPSGGWRSLLWVPAVYLFLLAGSEALLALVDVTDEQMSVQLLRGCTLSERLMLSLIVCGVVPVVEELLFRGILQSIPRVGIGVSAVCFACAHGINAYLLPLFFFGIVQSLWVRRSGSLIPAIMVHMLFNSVTFCFL